MVSMDTLHNQATYSNQLVLCFLPFDSTTSFSSHINAWNIIRPGLALYNCTDGNLVRSASHLSKEKKI